MIVRATALSMSPQVSPLVVHSFEARHVGLAHGAVTRLSETVPQPPHI